jgi:RNA polymerase sigma factor (sigma-70 family)
MARASSVVVGQIRTLFASGSLAGMPDGVLLERFLARRDDLAEAAFAALVARHGPMVLKVCRAILTDHQDAQDASQATFLLLAGKASGLRDRPLLAGWLYGVALRSAMKMRSRSARRRRHERRAAERSREAVSPPDADADRYAALHEAIDALPGRYRDPVVLCYLEELSPEEAAAVLRCPVNTLRVRLMRARDRLRRRLARRQLHLPPVLPSPVTAGMPPRPPFSASLARSTVEAAFAVSSGGADSADAIPRSILSLVKEVRGAMLMPKLKLIAGLLVAFGVVAAGVSVVAQSPRPAVPSGGGRDESDIMALERAWGEALVRGDASAMDRIVAYEMTGTDPSGGHWDKSSYLESVKAGAFGIESLRLADVKVRVVGDVAIATGRSIVNRDPRKGPAEVGAVYTDVYLRRNGIWQCVAWHSSAMPGGDGLLSPQASGVAPKAESSNNGPGIRPF